MLAHTLLTYKNLLWQFYGLKPGKCLLIYTSPLLLKQEFRGSYKIVWLRDPRHEIALLIAA